MSLIICRKALTGLTKKRKNVVLVVKVVFEKNLIFVFLKTTRDNFGQHINGISVKLLTPANAFNNHSNVVLVVDSCL